MPPSLLSAGPPVSNISSSAPHSPFCAGKSRSEGRKSIRQRGCLFQPKPPSLACPEHRLTAPENFGLLCRTSSRQRSLIFRNVGKIPNETALLLNQLCFIGGQQGIVGKLNARVRLRGPPESSTV